MCIALKLKHLGGAIVVVLNGARMPTKAATHQQRKQDRERQE